MVGNLNLKKNSALLLLKPRQLNIFAKEVQLTNWAIENNR